MSMRTTLSGCSLSKVRQAIGAADGKVIEAIEARVEEALEDYLDDGDEEEDGTPTQGRRMQDALKAVVAKLKGESADNLEDEGHVGYLAATTLLEHVDGDDRLRTPFEVKHFFWLDLLERQGKALGKDAELFRHLAEGRPLFGRTINNECLYAWFERDEAVRLRDAANRVAGIPGISGDVIEILTDSEEGLVACIDVVLAAGYDVWAQTT